MQKRLKLIIALTATLIFLGAGIYKALHYGEFNDTYIVETQKLADDQVPPEGSPNCNTMMPLPDFGGPAMYFEEEALEYLPKYNPRSTYWRMVDVSLLAIFITFGALLFHRRASYKWQLGLMTIAVIYYGFLRGGCICPVGSTGHVAIVIGNYGEVKLSTEAVLLFFIPLIFALFLGRVFCGSACPLGALQALCERFTTHIPEKVNKVLRIGRFVVLAWIIIAGIVSMSLPVCQYDPFVKIFRLSADTAGWIFSLSFLLICLTVARPFCRFLCPYSVLLGFFTLIGFKKREIIDVACIKCKKCVKVCPTQCITLPKINSFDCVCCGKCSKICPKDAIK